ncbi:hypothetical protein cyc_06482 [Cyclospora cayetanensis]|uniref:Uncharacterized protein n=1 Tax=Cyclospora cayetanensis TaxID=88456 RepID=A0A1D3CTS6_9EIME|nr:hypothetical protein cyc_06482 [Cyclospora cayetanensis]
MMSGCKHSDSGRHRNTALMEARREARGISFQPKQLLLLLVCASVMSPSQCDYEDLTLGQTVSVEKPSSLGSLSEFDHGDLSEDPSAVGTSSQREGVIPLEEAVTTTGAVGLDLEPTEVSKGRRKNGVSSNTKRARGRGPFISMRLCLLLVYMLIVPLMLAKHLSTAQAPGKLAEYYARNENEAKERLKQAMEWRANALAEYEALLETQNLTKEKAVELIGRVASEQYLWEQREAEVKALLGGSGGLQDADTLQTLLSQLQGELRSSKKIIAVQMQSADPVEVVAPSREHKWEFGVLRNKLEALEAQLEEAELREDVLQEFPEAVSDDFTEQLAHLKQKQSLKVTLSELQEELPSSQKITEVQMHSADPVEVMSPSREHEREFGVLRNKLETLQAQLEEAELRKNVLKDLEFHTPVSDQEFTEQFAHLKQRKAELEKRSEGYALSRQALEEAYELLDRWQKEMRSAEKLMEESLKSAESLNPEKLNEESSRSVEILFPEELRLLEARRNVESAQEELASMFAGMERLYLTPPELVVARNFLSLMKAHAFPSNEKKQEIALSSTDAEELLEDYFEECYAAMEESEDYIYVDLYRNGGQQTPLQFREVKLLAAMEEQTASKKEVQALQRKIPMRMAHLRAFALATESHIQDTINNHKRLANSVFIKNHSFGEKLFSEQQKGARKSRKVRFWLERCTPAVDDYTTAVTQACNATERFLRAKTLALKDIEWRMMVEQLQSKPLGQLVKCIAEGAESEEVKSWVDERWEETSKDKEELKAKLDNAKNTLEQLRDRVLLFSNRRQWTESFPQHEVAALLKIVKAESWIRHAEFLLTRLQDTDKVELTQLCLRMFSEAASTAIQRVQQYGSDSANLKSISDIHYSVLKEDKTGVQAMFVDAENLKFLFHVRKTPLPTVSLPQALPSSLIKFLHENVLQLRKSKKK